MAEIGKAPWENAVISGIGCSSRLPYYMNTYAMQTIHGRAAAISTGAKVVNPNLTVWQISGDGDGLAIGNVELLDVDNVVLGDAVLLTAGHDNCVLHFTSCLSCRLALPGGGHPHFVALSMRL